MIDLDALRLDRDRLTRRLEFLQDRARAHLEQQDGRSVERQACAGALLRDAAATALLLGDGPRAVELLMKAGGLWMNVGLPSAYLLVALALTAGKELTQEADAYFERVFAAFEDEHRAAATGRPDETLLRASAGSVRQALQLYEGLRLSPSRDGSDFPLLDHARSRLVERRDTLSGPAGARLGSYHELFDILAEGGRPSPQSDTILLLALRRREALEVAQQDSHHWKRAILPADIIDLDLVALALVTRDSRAAFELKTVFADRGPLTSLPFDVAETLQSRDRPAPISEAY